MRVKGLQNYFYSFCITCLFVVFSVAHVFASDLVDIKEKGVLRHLGIPYANFVTAEGTGLDVELMQRFARHLGVRYEFVQSNWSRVFGDLTGSHVFPVGDNVKLLGRAEIRGDVIATGLTMLEWRRKVVDYSTPTFPTQVLCLARKDFPMAPLQRNGNVKDAIRQVRAALAGALVMGKEKTCLDPALYNFNSSTTAVLNFPGGVNDLAPALLKGLADVSLIDVPDALVALDKWGDSLKIIGPISEEQRMGVAFRKESPELLDEFNKFFRELKESGEYRGMVNKYYPGVFQYYGEFFLNIKS
ncbi:transporter substrate-binding domain-containing protein [Desulfovibrio sp. JC010]|uniref:transporter substrate-binding domain-containing protein n=1 Tax=Desulfovibrio sp. JC010 TaxID=2593641 RepID=UPI001EF32437|nr:transporter substrate-binding domain-containing protein [Desulfovibrio sp. JC010]